MSDPRVTVVVVDDHPFFRDGVIRGLTNSGRVDVVGEAENGRDALDLIRREEPAVAVVDYQMPEMDGVAVVHAVVRDHLPTRVLLLSAVTDSAVVFRALEEGAAGYLSKDARRGEIVDAVMRVAAGHTVVPAELAGALASQIRMRASSNTPVLRPAPLNMRCLPTMPLEFASPCGKRLDLELSSSLGVSAPFAQTTTPFARWKTSRLSASKYFTPVTRPRASVSIFRTYEFGRISHRPVATAFGITVTSELDFARTSHPKPRQKPHCAHADRPSYCREAIAMGAGNDL